MSATLISPKHTPRISAKSTITLQVKRTYSGKSYVRAVPHTAWVTCPNEVTSSLLASAERVLPFDKVSNTTTCWELDLHIPRKRKREVLPPLVSYANRVDPLGVGKYLTDWCKITATTIKNKQDTALTSEPLTYPIYKERGNV